MTTVEDIENVLRANSYERDFFVRIETPHGEPALSSKRVTIVDIKKAAQALSEHSTKEQWISVEERLPECGIEVETDGKDGRQIAEWHHNHHNQIEWFVSFAKRDDVAIYTPSRWRPLRK